MPTGPAPLLFLHGSWHGTWCWSEVIARVTAAGRPAVAVDMAGHGLRARRARCLSERPFDPAGLTGEVSPVADVDLDGAGALLVDQLARIGGGRPVTVVAHSMGGAVLTRAAQRAPELVGRAVYLAAFMPGSDLAGGTYYGVPENADSLVGAVIRADAAVIGAHRIDLASADAGYRRLLRDAFYTDVDQGLADAAMGLLTPDAPAGIARGTTRLTTDGWGSVPRTYVVCTRDRALPPALQRKFIADADAAFPENPTSVVELDAAHSPFLSMPERLADVVAGLR
ncbi:alpha/beta fold hydrolase [Streptomyces sp. NPDC127068]|uniref:alpha/beta fold hydrolase n=1 Tax=Streptomyces sp. NPDC127068 TaxID=3347127 RepID=UPI003662248C